MKQIKHAAVIVGSVKGLAEKLGVSRQTVYRWGKDYPVPPKQAVEIERITDGAITREQLRPDLYR